ncbi:MAG: NAD(P)/FAD-dependent oxidoreductase [Bacteroidia bacterium]|nr:NAD(P)/FAD-dependent oxidoreductase [Bacteroidia bacterium]
MKEYDVVIVGSGLGGLACGVILAKEGYKVCILEKNKQIGGTLQTFVRKKVIFDSGVHYVGALDEGQTLNKLFRYLGIMDKLKIHKLDEDCFDGIMFEGDPKTYRHAQGYDRFIKNLLDDFPDEEAALHKYCDTLKFICEKFPLYNLRNGDYFDKLSVLEWDTRTFIESITTNKRLQNVLAGSTMLYAGMPYQTPLYVHALVLNSYILSSYRFKEGGSQIARHLAREITSRGGEIIKYARVSLLKEEDGLLQYAQTEDGQRYYGKRFISNLHPAKTMEITESDLIKKAYRNRLSGIENSISSFYLNAVVKKDTFPYVNSNYYYFTNDDAWSMVEYTPGNWPRGLAIFYSRSEKNPAYCNGVTLMTYMHYNDVKKWENTYNIESKEQFRGDDYEAFKQAWAEKLIDAADKRFPGLKDAIESYYVATPLTFRDYVGTDDGNLYGYLKDYRDPMKTLLSPRTKVPNLYLTGQNLNLHGVMGVTVSAVLTCSEILGLDYLIGRIHGEAPVPSAEKEMKI